MIKENGLNTEQKIDMLERKQYEQAKYKGKVWTYDRETGVM